MFDPTAEKPPRSNLQVLLGFLLGVVASLGCLFLTIFLASTFGSGHEWMYPAFDAATLIAVGVLAFRQRRESSYAVGALIAVSLALLLDAACAVVFLK